MNTYTGTTNIHSLSLELFICYEKMNTSRKREKENLMRLLDPFVLVGHFIKFLVYFCFLFLFLYPMFNTLLPVCMFFINEAVFHEDKT